ncbi:MAG TPA: hypothetical protein VF488_09960, partial [Gemmatimonadaceae bacterium]
YTVDTLAALAARDPEARHFLLIGEDLAEQIESWREPRRIAALAELVVLVRGEGGGAYRAPAPPALPVTRIATRRVDVSSTEVRARVRAGRPIRGFVTDAVADFIRSAGLYR